MIYADNGGAVRPSPAMLDAVMEHMRDMPLANPHSRNAPARVLTELVEQARHRYVRRSSR